MKGQCSILKTASTRQLLATNICDLDLSIRHSNIADLQSQLYAELANNNLRFKPAMWISTSWFSPYGVPGFAIPFYLLHPRLRELEEQYIGEVEGGTRESCMKLLRHEAGHAIDNAFHLRKSKRRQALFGLSGIPYPTRYKPDLRSNEFVKHLENSYAQAHPDEDWAETFAVWLDPKSKWRTRYKNSPALAKLELLDELVTGIARKRQIIHRVHEMESFRKCKIQVIDYLRAKRRKYRKFAGTAIQSHNHSVGVKSSWIKM